MKVTPNRLVHGVAEALGVPASAVSQIDRQLAENGLRKTGGRGASTPDMTSDDAAALVIASMGGESVDSYWRIASDTRDFLAAALPSPHAAVSLLPQFSAAVGQRNCTLRNALAALIADAIAGDLEKTLGKKPTDLSKGFYLRIERPSGAAVMGFNPEEEFHFMGAFDMPAQRDGIQTTHSISAGPLVRIAKMMRG